MEEYPLIEHVKYTMEDLKRLKLDLKDNEEYEKIIFEFPTVYIILYKAKKNQYHAYVGETNDIDRRTAEHINYDPDEGGRDDFKELRDHKSDMLIIGHDHFNKSLTLDIENEMMLYLLSSNGIARLNNRRTNVQGDYYPKTEFHDIFDKIWQHLNKCQPDVFQDAETIQNSAIFKSSPYHKLLPEQEEAARKIEDRIAENLKNYNDSEKGNLIVVEGAAGTGKTVLMSQIFKDLNMNQKKNHPKAFLLVNHYEQEDVYKEIANKLGFRERLDRNITNRPSAFISKHDVNNKVDVVLIDEAHLLWTQPIQSYKGTNQLDDILHRAKVVVIIFDRHQVVNKASYLTNSEIEKLESNAQSDNNLVQLNDQIRMNADNNTINWMNNLIFNQEVTDIPDDTKGYELKISDDINLVYRKIMIKNGTNKSKNGNNSRMLATYDWKHTKRKQPTDSKFWMVRSGSFALPWNKQLDSIDGYESLPWVEQPQTIKEVGSIYTIQGFDLNYAGLIIGPSVQFRNGKIEYNYKFSKDHNVTNRRTIDGEKVNVSAELIQNELNILMKRGVKGLYIYAVDDQLREELMKKAGKKHL